MQLRIFKIESVRHTAEGKSESLLLYKFSLLDLFQYFILYFCL